MYLFIFTLLLLLFQFINSKNIFDDSNARVASYKEQVEKYKDSIVVLNDEMSQLSHFNLDRNDDAITYFEKKGVNVDKLIPFIEDELYSLNGITGEHPIIPYAPAGDGKLLINTIKILNHKWILTDFSDGTFWGELFITYEVTDDNKLKFNLSESFLYPLN